MNHLKNIKQMLSIPTGSRNTTVCGYNSLTDSQFFTGSQFWTENSQSVSQEKSLSSRTSLQSSQEGSNPKFSNTYQTKPLLFGELKEKSQGFGILCKFEEDKKKATEKHDSNIFAKEYQHTRETLNNIQQLLAGADRNMAACQAVLEKFDDFASTLQNNLSDLQSDISQRLETLENNVNLQKDMTATLEEKLKKSGDAKAELASNLQSFKNNLESVREEQEKEQHVLGEVLRLLSTLVSEHSAKASPQKLMDSAIQTSPVERSSSDILQDNKLEGTPLVCTSCYSEPKQVEAPPQVASCSSRKRKLSHSVRGYRRCRRTPLVPSQRKGRNVPDENRQPLVNCNKQMFDSSVSASRRERSDPKSVTSRDSLNPECVKLLNREKRCFITPLTCWSPDSSSSLYMTGNESMLDKMPAETKTSTPVKRGGFLQLFDMDCNSDFDF